jgi:hypothetical protein
MGSGRVRGPSTGQAGAELVAQVHFEADECGALNQFLAVAPQAVPLCGRLLAMLSVNDIADREAHILSDAEILQTGKFGLQWLDTLHLPRGWEAGLIMEHATGALLCSDLFADGGTNHPALFEGDILGPSDAFRRTLGNKQCARCMPKPSRHFADQMVVIRLEPRSAAFSRDPDEHRRQ